MSGKLLYSNGKLLYIDNKLIYKSNTAEPDEPETDVQIPYIVVNTNGLTTLQADGVSDLGAVGNAIGHKQVANILEPIDIQPGEYVDENYDNYILGNAGDVLPQYCHEITGLTNNMTVENGHIIYSDCENFYLYDTMVYNSCAWVWKELYDEMVNEIETKIQEKGGY
jgi:hypothetical protein